MYIYVFFSSFLLLCWVSLFIYLTIMSKWLNLPIFQDAFIKISRTEGPASLWSGLSPTLVLAVPATVVYFVTYEQLRARLNDRYGCPGCQPVWVPLVSGCMARLWSATAVSPLELIRTKMQSKRLSYFGMFYHHL